MYLLRKRRESLGPKLVLHAYRVCIYNMTFLVVSRMATLAGHNIMTNFACDRFITKNLLLNSGSQSIFEIVML